MIHSPHKWPVTRKMFPFDDVIMSGSRMGETIPGYNQNTPVRHQWVTGLHKFHNAPVLYPTMHHFVTEMCTRVQSYLTKWCIVGYFLMYCEMGLFMLPGHGALKDNCDQLYDNRNISGVLMISRRDTYLQWTFWSTTLKHFDKHSTTIPWNRNLRQADIFISKIWRQLKWYKKVGTSLSTFLRGTSPHAADFMWNVHDHDDQRAMIPSQARDFVFNRVRLRNIHGLVFQYPLHCHSHMSLSRCVTRKYTYE